MHHVEKKNDFVHGSLPLQKIIGGLDATVYPYRIDRTELFVLNGRPSHWMDPDQLRHRAISLLMEGYLAVKFDISGHLKSHLEVQQ